MDTGANDGDLLTAMGVHIDSLNPEDLNVLDKLIKGVDIMEVYSLEGVEKLAEKFGLVAGASLDLTNGYDFDKKEDQERVWKHISSDKPALYILLIASGT